MCLGIAEPGPKDCAIRLAAKSDSHAAGSHHRTAPRPRQTATPATTRFNRAEPWELRLNRRSGRCLGTTCRVPKGAYENRW